MANLETLVLTINANAENARQGIDNLITSLSSLSSAMTKPLADLKNFNAELKTLKQLSSSVRIPNIAKASGAAAATARAKQRIKDAYNPATNNNRITDVTQLKFPNAKSEDRWQREYADNIASRNAERQALREAAERGALRREATSRAAQMAGEQATKAAKEEMDARGEVAKTIIENASTYDLLKLKYDSLKQATIDDARAGKLTNEQLVQRTAQLRKLEEQMQQTEKSTKETSSTLGKLKEGFKGMFSGLEGIISRIKRIAITMLIRSAIRNLIKDIKEGITNVQEWSKTVGGEGNSLAKAMQSFKARTMTMKNALGAMLSPVIQALIPLLNSLTSAIINAANWFNQFISLLSGKTSWTKAIQQTADDVEDTTSAVGGATKAAKEAIAAFDELNVLTTSSGSGGGGGTSQTTEDYSNMFEQISQFDQKIREISEFVKNNLETIKTLAGLVGTALLGWKLGTAFMEVLPTLSTIFGYVATGATIALTVALDYMLTGQYLDTKESGWFWASILTTAVGSTAAWTIARKLIGGQAGAYAAGITLTLTAAADIVANVNHTDVSALSKESILVNAKAAIEAATGIGLIASATGSGLAGTLTAAGGGGLITFGVAMGLKTIFDKTNTEWSSKDTIFGALASSIPIGLGLFVLGTGAAIATIATLATFGAVIAIKAMMPKEKITWGEVELTEEEVQAFVDNKMFNVNVKAAMNVIHDSVEMTALERASLQVALTNVVGTFKVIKLGVAQTQDYEQMHKDVDTLVADINSYIDTIKKQNKLVLQYTPTLAGTETGEWFTSSNQGWSSIQTFVEEKGKTIGNWLTSQESKEIKDAVPDVVAAAMEQLTAVTNAIAQAKIGAEAFGEFKLTLGDLDEASFTDVINKFKEYKEGLTEEYTKLVEDAYTNQAALVEALKITLGDDYENDPEYQKQLKILQDMGANMSQAVKDGVESASAPGSNMIKDWLDKQFEGTVDLGEDYWYDLFERQGLTGEDLPSALRNILEQSLTPEQLEIADLVGFTGWDILSEEMKRGLLSSTEITPETLKALKEQSNVSAVDIFKFSDWDNFTQEQKKEFAAAVSEAYGSDEALKAAKEAGIDIGEMLSDSVDGSVKDPEIGATADVADAKAEGGKISDAVDGQVKDPTVGASADTTSAKSAGSTITSTVAKNTSSPVIKPTTDSKSMTKIGTDVKGIFTKDYSVTSVALTKDAKSKIGTDVTTAADGKKIKTINLNKDAKKGLTSDVMGAVDGKNVTKIGMTKDAKTKFGASVADAGSNQVVNEVGLSSASKKKIGKDVKDAASGAKTTITAEVEVKKSTVIDTMKKLVKAVAQLLGIPIPTGFAKGGFPTQGQLFIAREAGAEMVGTIGNQTAVANNDQIVEGIASGVAAANAEQNNLLRQQNQILMGILQKSGNVTIGASSSLGRVVNQSLQMYGQMTGV